MSLQNSLWLLALTLKEILVFWSLEAATKYNNKPLKRGKKDSEELKDS